ncbi:MAG: hypothetical protein ACR2NZ_03120 [Rubripirellula sp.]
MTRTSIDASDLESRTLSSTVQQVTANEAKGLHLAAEHPEHGQVTYLQEVTDGGFFVYVGAPDALEEHWFGPGSWVAFNDDHGSGHASKVGPDGCTRTFRMLRGHMDAKT